jgi:hypothetical protein
LVILLIGASATIETEHLGDGQDTADKINRRKKLFSAEYWVLPFGNISVLREGLNERNRERNCEVLPKALVDLLNWIHADLTSGGTPSLIQCGTDKARIIDPALRECGALLDAKPESNPSSS